MTERSADPQQRDFVVPNDRACPPRDDRQRAMRGAAAATLVAMLWASGCASSPLRYHALVAVAPSVPAASTASYDGPVLQIAVVRLPAELDRAELLHESAPGRFEVAEGDHWAGPLARLARQALAEDLAARLPTGRTTFPGAAWPAAEAQLSVDILSFALRDGTASMQLSWSLRCEGATAPSAVATAPSAVATAPSAVATAPSAVATAPSAVAMAPSAGAQWQLQTPAADQPSALSALLAQLADRLATEPTIARPMGNAASCRTASR